MVRNTSLQKILISAVMLVLLALCAAFSATFAYADGENYWTESPDIVRWTYGGFNKVTNVIKGKPAHGTPTFFDSSPRHVVHKRRGGVERFYGQ